MPTVKQQQECDADDGLPNLEMCSPQTGASFSARHTSCQRQTIPRTQLLPIPTTPQLLAEAFSGHSRVNTFAKDLCRAFLSADIPLWKLTNDELRRFLEKYTNEAVPDESTLRKRYLRERKLRRDTPQNQDFQGLSTKDKSRTFYSVRNWEDFEGGQRSCFV